MIRGSDFIGRKGQVAGEACIYNRVKVAALTTRAINGKGNGGTTVEDTTCNHRLTGLTLPPKVCMA
jgi:hypothetical protein